ncbi:uncharacterized protein LOC131008066 [Salvia miltiorrhiza]|uniref:uncharacterized protein LOC131008066 n=1 Tax=Salvia miltiorrhiza TaxID=226208 RepID=UPI0025AC1DDF|nr:uncharacterized protein LOC131008066 [Salvia miltiorrhiza]
MIPRLNGSPFSNEILLEPFPVNYRPISLDYDGTADPKEHMAWFEGLVALHQYAEGIKCRIFVTTLSGVAQRWFRNLKADSIHSFGDLYLTFMRQFANATQVKKTVMSLMDIMQEAHETLREYIARFNVIALDVLDVESQIKGYAFVKGLKPGPLFDRLLITPPRDFDDIMAVLPGYLQLEDAKAAWKAESDKHRSKKSDNNTEHNDRHYQRAPYKGLPPRIPTMSIEMQSTPPRAARDEGEGRDGEDMRRRTPLNRHVEEIFHIIKDERWFRAPWDYTQGDPKPRRNKSLYEYHNAYGHSTAQCGHLQHQLEILVRKGLLDRFIDGLHRDTPKRQRNDNHNRERDYREKRRTQGRER